MSESSFNKLLRARLEGIAGLRFYRIESHSTAPGIPDNHYISIYNGASGWIEVKEENIMPLRIDFRKRPAQPVWHIEYAKHRGRSFILLHVRLPVSRIILIPGRFALAAARELRLTPRWEFRESSATIWSDIGAILSGSQELTPPDPEPASKIRPSRKLRLTGGLPEGE